MENILTPTNKSQYKNRSTKYKWNESIIYSKDMLLIIDIIIKTDGHLLLHNAVLSSSGFSICYDMLVCMECTHSVIALFIKLYICHYMSIKMSDDVIMLCKHIPNEY